VTRKKKSRKMQTISEKKGVPTTIRKFSRGLHGFTGGASQHSKGVFQFFHSSDKIRKSRKRGNLSRKIMEANKGHTGSRGRTQFDFREIGLKKKTSHWRKSRRNAAARGATQKRNCAWLDARNLRNRKQSGGKI